MRNLSVVTAILLGGCVLPAPFDTQQPSGGSAPLAKPVPTVRRDDTGTLVVETPDGQGGTGAVPVYLDNGRFNPEAATLSTFVTDPVEDRAFVVQSFPTATLAELNARWPNRYRDAMRVKTLYALDPDGTTRTVQRLDGESDASVVFTDDAVLLVTCDTVYGGRIRRYDRQARTLLREATLDGCRANTNALMPHRVVVQSSNGAIHYVDPVTLVDGALRETGNPSGTTEFPLRGRDASVRIVYDDEATPSDYVLPLRVELYEMAGVSVERLSRLTPSRVWRIALGGATLFSGYPLALTPDERELMFPGAQTGSLIDLATGAVRSLPGNGTIPRFASFTPDGQGYIGLSLADYNVGSARLWHVSLEDLSARPLSITVPTAPRIAFAPDSPYALLVAGRTDIGLWRMDLARGTARSLGSFGAIPPAYTVSRAGGGEAWIAHDGLTRVNLASLESLRAPIDWVPTRVAVAPRGDGVLVDRPRRNTVVRLDGASGQIDREHPLPVPAPPTDGR